MADAEGQAGAQCKAERARSLLCCRELKRASNEARQLRLLARPAHYMINAPA